MFPSGVALTSYYTFKNPPFGFLQFPVQKEIAVVLEVVYEKFEARQYVAYFNHGLSVE